MNTTQSTSITPFLYGETTIRTLERDGTPWFVAKDACAAVHISNYRDACASLDADEKGVVNIDTLGGEQQMLIINEPGLYRLIFKSRKAEARTFQRWVYHEVLPAIRRHGCYQPGHQAYLSLIRDSVALGVSPNLAARAALKLTNGTGARVPSVAAPSAQASAPTDPIENRLRELMAIMEPGVLYTSGQLLSMLPEKHPLRRPKEKGVLTKIGAAIARGAKRELIERIHGRHAQYRLAHPENIVAM
jgi:hypothetical protein